VGRYNDTQTVTVTTLHASVENIRITTAPLPSDAVPDVQSIAFRASGFSIDAESTVPITGNSSFRVNPTQPADMAFSVTQMNGAEATVPLTLEFDQSILSLTTLQELDNEFLSNRSFFDSLVARFPWRHNLVFGTSMIPRNQQGFAVLSFVTQIRAGNDVIPGHILTRPGFGTIQFGLIIASPTSRRFTIAHIKMNSNPGGRADFCAVEDTGIWGTP
jgi:hypothetical protein